MSCVPPFVFWSSILAVNACACFFQKSSCVYSYIYHNSPGKKPLVQSLDATKRKVPLSSIVRGETGFLFSCSSGILAFAESICVNAYFNCCPAKSKLSFTTSASFVAWLHAPHTTNNDTNPVLNFIIVILTNVDIDLKIKFSIKRLR